MTHDEALKITLDDELLLRAFAAAQVQHDIQVTRLVALRQAFADKDEGLAMMIAKNFADTFNRDLTQHAKHLAGVLAARRLLE